MVTSRDIATLAVVGALAGFGCAGEDPAMRRDVQELKAEVETLARQNADLGRRVEQISNRVDLLSARKQARRDAPEQARAKDGVVPANLPVVKERPPRHGRPPPVPTATPLVEPDPSALEALGAPGDDIAGEAGSALEAARALEGAASARALERFAASYPHHPQADNALVQAARLYAAAGDADAGCAAAARVVSDYPASDDLASALALLAECQERKGDRAAARATLGRLVKDFPDSPAARAASQKLAQFGCSAPARCARRSAEPTSSVGATP